MSAVVTLGDFKNKGTVMLLRELLGRALRGQVAGIAFSVEFRDGTQKTGFTGVCRSSQRTAANAATGGDEYADSSFDDPAGVVRRLRKSPS